MKVKRIIRVAYIEWIKWILNPRMLIALMIIPVTKMLVVSPLLDRAASEGEQINLLEPLLALCNSKVLLLIIPAAFIVLMSDFPTMEQNTLFYVSRSGRACWMWGQFLFSLMASVSYLAIIYGGVIIGSLGNVFIGREWSRPVRLYLAWHPEMEYSYVSQLLPSNLYNQLDVSESFFYNTTLALLFFMTICSIMLMFTALGKRSLGLFTAVLVLLAGTASCALEKDIQWLFPVSHMVIWIHYTEITRKAVYAVWKSYAYFLLVIGACLITGRIFINRVGFENGGK